jgi:hypothetical protein
MLCLRYVTHVGINIVRTWERMLDHESIENHITTTHDGNQQQLTLENITLFCYYPRGAPIKRDMNCNSAFMREHMPIFAANPSQKMHWIPME